MIKNYYNIHNIIKIEINKEKKGLFWNLNPEFEYFKVNQLDQPDIIVNIKKFKPNLYGCYIVDGKYYVKNDYIYYKNKNYIVEIEGLEEFSPIVLNINPTPHKIRKFWPILASQNIFLRPLIEILAVRRGFALLHSAGISEGENGYLLVGRSGVYKTSLTIDLLKKGMKFIGDENILIKNNKIYSYPFNIRSFVFKKDIIGYESVHGFYNKYKLLNYIKKKDDLNIKIQEQSILNKIYVIERNLKVGDMKIKSIDKSKLTKKMILNEKMEFDIAPTHTFSGINNYNFQSLINAYLIINYNSLIVNFWIMYKKLIQDIIKTNIKLFYIYMPKEYDSKYGIQLYQHLRGKKND